MHACMCVCMYACICDQSTHLPTNLPTYLSIYLFLDCGPSDLANFAWAFANAGLLLQYVCSSTYIATHIHIHI